MGDEEGSGEVLNSEDVEVLASEEPELTTKLSATV